MEQELFRLKQEAEEALELVSDAVQLEAFRVKYLGRKGGLLTSVLRQLGRRRQRIDRDSANLPMMSNRSLKFGLRKKKTGCRPPSPDLSPTKLITVCLGDICRSASCTQSPR
jgi:hypothetical protein